MKSNKINSKKYHKNEKKKQKLNEKRVVGISKYNIEKNKRNYLLKK